jgi:CspA family cold shock protein
MKGTVKFFNESKGYGFITNDETGEDIFVHVTSLEGVKLNEGDKVEYSEEDGRKGKVAANVTLIEE